jgi:hypothetical protein
MRYFVLVIILAGLSAGRENLALAANPGSATSSAEPVRTAKERLSDKASDEQRLNDCKVPPARRTRPRPTGCP